MNHYQLYRMIYWRILEATCTVMYTVSIVGALIIEDGDIAWIFWVMTVVSIVLRLRITRSVMAFEDGMGIDKQRVI